MHISWNIYIYIYIYILSMYGFIEQAFIVTATGFEPTTTC